METRRSTIGVLIVVVAVLVASLAPVGADDCVLCTTAEHVLLGIGALGSAVGAWLALSDRRWTARLLPSVGVVLVAAVLVTAIRLAV